MKGASRRAKGQAFERWLCKDLQPLFERWGCKLTRGLDQSRDGGKVSPDVCGTPFHIEAKHHAKLDLRAAYEQAVADSEHTRLVPVAIGRENRKQPRVMIDLWQLCDLVYEGSCHGVFAYNEGIYPVEITYEQFRELLGELTDDFVMRRRG